MNQTVLAPTIVSPRILINSSPSGCPHLLARVIESLNYKSYAKSPSYQAGTPTSFNFKQSQQAYRSYQDAQVSPDGTALNSQLIPSSADAKADAKAGTEIGPSKIGLGGLSPYAVEASIVQFWLDQVSAQQYILGHIPYSPVLSQVLADLNYCHVVVIANPLAIAASLLTFALDPNRPVKHFLQDDLLALPPEQRLQFLLDGGDAPLAGVRLDPFADVYRSVLSWRSDSDCIVVYLEDLAISPSQPLSERQLSVIQQLTSALENILYPKDKLTETRLYRKMTQASLPEPFRPDAWRNSLSVREIEQLLDYCEPLCSEAGYQI